MEEFPFANTVAEGLHVRSVEDLPYANTVALNLNARTVEDLPYAYTVAKGLAAKIAGRLGYANMEKKSLSVKNVRLLHNLLRSQSLQQLALQVQREREIAKTLKVLDL